MLVALPQAVLVAALSIFLFLVLCGALVAFALVVVAIAPVKLPALIGIIVALLGTAVAVIGGNPVTRRVLEIATRGRVRETEDGGILVPAPDAAEGDEEAVQTLMRGGTVIGYLERIAVVLSIIAGYPEAIAVVVAVKGIGRFPELAASEARERFIIGTLASLLWAAVIGGLVRLAIW